MSFRIRKTTMTQEFEKAVFTPTITPKPEKKNGKKKKKETVVPVKTKTSGGFTIGQDFTNQSDFF